MSALPIDLLIEALSRDGACYVLGAGASWPPVPTMSQLPEKLSTYASQLSSIPASKLPESPLRDLIEPMIKQAKTDITIQSWQAAWMTPAAIAVALEDIISKAHRYPLPQYAVFQMIPPTTSIVSFNWDGLARARCYQANVFHPHGIIRPRLLSRVEFDELFEFAQDYDPPDARDWLLPGIVMLGEEEEPRLNAIHQKVLEVWRHATIAIVIGYRFGISSQLKYDRVWLEIFTEAFRVNNQADIHIIAPKAVLLREELKEQLKRTINVYAWPLNWYAFSLILLQCANKYGLTRLADFLTHRVALEEISRLMVGNGVTA